MVQPLPATGRWVRELRLRAGSREAAQHAAILLEDALRTSTLPGGTDGGRLVILRKVDLGRIPVRASAASLALRLEQCCRSIAPVDVESVEDSTAADAVAFAGLGDAIRILAERWATRGAVSEWYWERVIPGWSGELSRSNGWRCLLGAALGTDAPVPAVAGVIHAAVRAGRIPELLTAVVSIDPGPSYVRCGWGRPRMNIDGAAAQGRASPSVADAGADVSTGADDAPSGLEIPAVFQALFREGGLEVREWLAWMVAMLEVRRRPVGASGDSRLAGRAWRQLEAALRREDRGDVVGAGRNPTGSVAGPAGESIGHEPHPGAPHEEIAPGWNAGEHPLSRREHEEIATVVDASDGIETTEGATPVATPVRRVAPGGLETGIGGLLFLIPVLERIGLRAELEARPGGENDALGVAVLWEVARRVGGEVDDPIFTVLREWVGPGASDGWIRERAATQSVRDWIRRARRWCRVEAGIGLASLVRRRARLRTSSTHLEVRFRLALADLRVRRSGLDIDPGWVPWIGRVVRYEYQADHEWGEHDD